MHYPTLNLTKLQSQCWEESSAPPTAWERPFTQPEIKRFDWITAGEGAMAGWESVKLQVKVNSQQKSSVILLTQTIQQELLGAWDVVRRPRYPSVWGDRAVVDFQMWSDSSHSIHDKHGKQELSLLITLWFSHRCLWPDWRHELGK